METALLVILLLPAQFALDLQLLGGLMDPANVSGPDFRPLHRLVPGARSHCQMGGRFFGGHMARLGKSLRTLRRRVTLQSGQLALGGNIPVAILVSAVLRFSTRGSVKPRVLCFDGLFWKVDHR